MTTNSNKTPQAAKLLALFIVLVSCMLPTIQAHGQESQFQPLIDGIEHYRKGNYAQALEAFEEAATIFPDDPDIRFYLGLTHLQLGQVDDAIKKFQTTLDMDPGYTDARYQMGLALLEQERYKAAIEHLEKVHKGDPEREDVGYFLGFAYYELGEYEQALQYLETAKTSDERIQELTLYYTGLAHHQLGRKEKAKDLYSELFTLDPTSRLATTAMRLSEVIALEERVKKRFNLEVTTRFQYDDNLILVPTTDVFNLRDREHKTTMELLFARGEYVLVRTPQYSATAAIGTFQTVNNQISGFNVSDLIGELAGAYRGTFQTLIRKDPFPFRANIHYIYFF